MQMPFTHTIFHLFQSFLLHNIGQVQPLICVLYWNGTDRYHQKITWECMCACGQTSVSHRVQCALYCLPQCLGVLALAGTFSWQNPVGACRCHSSVWSSSYSVNRVQVRPTSKTVSFARLMFPYTDKVTGFAQNTVAHF